MATSDPQPTVPPRADAPPTAVPPQQPGEIGRPAQAPTWPTVIGVISIVFGAGACLGGVWGLFAPQFLDLMAKQMPQGQAEMFSAVQEWSTWMVVNAALTVIIALVLLAAGIELVRRRARGVKLCRVWAVLKIIFGIVGAYIGLQIQQAQFREMSQGNLPVGGGFYVVVGVVSMVFGIAWTCAYPVFLLIWFSRAKVKNEYTQWP